MPHHPLLPVFAVLASTAGIPAQSATFDAGSAEGWISVTLGYPTAGVPPLEIAPPAVNPQVQTSGGNPGGYLSVVDPDGTWPIGNTQYWKAPANLLGNRLDHLDGEIAFDVLLTTNLTNFDEDDILITGGGVTLAWFTGVQPVPNVWTHVAAPLSVGGWHVGDRSGPLATQADLTTVLGALGSMYLRGEFQLGPDVMGLDNVVFAAPASAQAFGAGCGGVGYPAPVLTATSAPVFGSTFTLQTTSATTTGFGIFLLSTSSLPGVDLTFLGLPGCLLYVPPDFLDSAAVVGGSMPYNAAIPNAPTLAGVHLFVQSGVFAQVNPFGLAVSNAVDGVLGL